MIAPVSILEMERRCDGVDTAALLKPDSRWMVSEGANGVVWITARGASGRLPAAIRHGIDPVGSQQSVFISVLLIFVSGT